MTSVHTTTCCPDIVSAMWTYVCDDAIDIPNVWLQGNVGTHVDIHEGMGVPIVMLLHIFLVRLSVLL